MNPRRTACLRAIAETFAPPGARVERIAALAAAAIESLSPGRRAQLEALLDLLALPMRAHAATRAGTLKLLADSPVAALRSGFAALKRLTLFLTYAESEPGNDNPLWAAIGYPGPRADRGAADPPLPLAVARNGERVSADVIVIGSGAGGGLAASAFARAGKRVVVLEAGPALDARAVTQRELAMSDLYLDGGLTATKDLGVAILAGAALGGGTTVNWCTSFELPETIGLEWERECAIEGFFGQLQPHYRDLERRLDLAPCARHNANNQTIVDGARALGVHCGAMPRNAPADCGEGCGYCGFGCAYGKKRSTPRAFLPDVALAGGAIYAGARAERIVLAGHRAKAVEALQTVAGDARRFEVDAALVVVAAGALRTPGLLARSGVRHPLLGRRLFLHPVAALFAEYSHPIATWHGPMQSAYSDAYDNRAGAYGVKIEVAPTHPGLAALALPWVDREQHSRAVMRAQYAAAMIAVARDRDPGSIDLDSEEQIRYAVSPFDGETLLHGILGMADLAFAAGAQRITTLHNRPIAIERSAWSSARRALLNDELHRIGFAPNRQIFFSAHQMGTAAMGADARMSVVDPAGRPWGYDNLLVADASLFPQASGVNPMLTVLAMASRVVAQHGAAP